MTDQEIAHCIDISNAQMFIDVLQKKSSKAHLFSVTDTDIKNIETLLPKKLKPIPNIMKLHQLVWSRETKSALGLRELTCISCGTDLACKHFTASPETIDFSLYEDDILTNLSNLEPR